MIRHYDSVSTKCCEETEKWSNFMIEEVEIFKENLLFGGETSYDISNESSCILEGENFVSEDSKVETCIPETIQCC